MTDQERQIERLSKEIAMLIDLTPEEFVIWQEYMRQKVK